MPWQDYQTAIDEGKLGELSDDLIAAILEEAGKFANEVLAPLNRVGDEHGAKLVNHEVITAPGWKETYRIWCEGGWNSLTGPIEYGGQGLPTMLSVAVSEMWNSAAMAFGLAPLLTAGAIDAIEAHGSQELKDIYLEKMVSGQWTGTMNLTESQAGSYLAALTSRAEPRRRQQLQGIWPENIYHLWRTRHERKYLPSGAGPFARCAGRDRWNLALFWCPNFW